MYSSEYQGLLSINIERQGINICDSIFRFVSFRVFNITMTTASDNLSIVWTEESVSSSFDTNSYSATSNNTTKERLSSSKRTRYMLLIMIAIVVLMIVAIVVAALSFLYMNKVSTTEPTIVANDNLTASAYSRAPIIYEVGEGGESGHSPCTSYTAIDDPLRNVAAPSIGSACDTGPFFNTSIGGRWIRFVGTGGTMIPVTSVGTQHCGAYLTAWINGTLPTTSNVIVNSTVCIDSLIGTCLVSLPVSLIKCNNFYVYFLPPLPFCNARYCTV
ncbi:unnamed protein product [Adineta ricciae]|uniref:Uncharacterized protein n=1 Tax=Adineta ricciae TaxID=249248 RepID=A0A815HDE0_ADIRI|nr:unnamed protein product [Adineta ricciae]